MQVTQAKMCISYIPQNGGKQQLCGRVENALALEGESGVLNGHKEWPENILQASVNTTITEIMLVTGLIYGRINCYIQRIWAAFVSAACTTKRLKLQ